jgi:hypothetical protein
MSRSVMARIHTHVNTYSHTLTHTYTHAQVLLSRDACLMRRSVMTHIHTCINTHTLIRMNRSFSQETTV